MLNDLLQSMSTRSEMLVRLSLPHSSDRYDPQYAPTQVRTELSEDNDCYENQRSPARAALSLQMVAVAVVAGVVEVAVEGGGFEVVEVGRIDDEDGEGSELVLVHVVGDGAESAGVGGVAGVHVDAGAGAGVEVVASSVEGRKVVQYLIDDG